MDSSLLDQNTVSIIRSPNKQFYYMAALDSNDLENFCVTKELKLPDTILVHHSNDMVNDWHIHSNENISIDNITGTGYYMLNEQLPNYGRSSICYPVSSELSAIDSQNSFDFSNSCGNLAIAQNDSVPGLPNTSRKDVSELDVAGFVSLEGMSHSQAHIQNDDVNTNSFVDVSDPSDGFVGCCNAIDVKPKRMSMKSAKKSKSFYCSSNNPWKNFGPRLSIDSEMSAHKQNNIQMLSEISCGHHVSSNGVLVQLCSSQSSSHPTFGQCVNTTENSRSENSDGKGDSESSGKEEDEALTSGFTSTGHDSNTIDQIWDGYQVPLYVAISDDSTEEKLDATYLQGEWQQLTDDFMDFTDFGNDRSSHSQLSQHQTSELDSDTDAEEMLHLIKESSDALRLTRLSLSELKLSDGSMQSSLHREPLATCSTNIKCLRDLLDIVKQEDWTHNDVNQLSDLLKQWENVESEFLRLTFRKDLSTSHPDIFLDLSPDALAVPTASQKINDSSSDINTTMMESTSSPNCHFKRCNKSFFTRFDVLDCNIRKLLKESSTLHQATLLPIQIVFFIIFLLIFLYFIAFSNRCTDMVGIKFDPQLRYVIGPPPL